MQCLVPTPRRHRFPLITLLFALALSACGGAATTPPTAAPATA